MEQCVPVNAALTLHMTLLKIQVKKLEQRLNKLDSQSPQPAASFCVGFVPSKVDGVRL